MAKAKSKEKVKESEVKTVMEVIKPSVEEQILGASDEVKVVKVVDYSSLKAHYKVKNLVKNREFALNGYEIGAILGVDNNARKALKEGAKVVYVANSKGENVYKIEVVK